MSWRRVFLHSTILAVLTFSVLVPVGRHQGRPWPEAWLLPLILVGVSVGILIITTDRTARPPDPVSR